MPITSCPIERKKQCGFRIDQPAAVRQELFNGIILVELQE
jgi:hypothetical protein